jgi:hypothetical protein
VLFLVDHRLQFSGKKVGIIGLAIAKRVEAFDCPVNYYQRTKQAYPSYTYYPSVVEQAASSDVLVVACPLNEHIVSREVVEALGPRGVLVNIGRGPHVDEPALVAEGRLGGAGLDVFEDEPNVPEALFALDNVVVVPHVGSGTRETRTADLVLGNLEAHVAGKPLLTPVVWFCFWFYLSIHTYILLVVCVGGARKRGKEWSKLCVATKGYVIGRLRVWNARLLYSPAAAAPSRLVSHTVLAVMPPEACIAFLLHSY